MAINALTRIRNNQVYNSDINAQYKLQPYSVTGGLLSNNFTYTGNMTIGNLVVNGVTTTIDTTNLVVADPLLAINRNQSGTPSYDLGFVMGRGNQTNVAMIWEEGSQQFQLQYTTESTAATTFGTINNSGYANLQAYGVKLNNATITGSYTATTNYVSNTNITGGRIDNTTIGATTPNSGVFTSVTLANGGQFVGYFTGAIGANTPNTGAFTTASTTGNLTVGGNITITGNVLPSANVIYNLGSPTARWKAVYLAGNTVYIGGIGISDGGGYLQVLDVNGNQLGIQTASINATIIGNSIPAAGTFTTLTATGAVNVTNGGTIAGYLNGPLGANTPNTVVATSVTTSSGGQITGYLNGAIGANTANSGAFTTLTTTSTITSQGTIAAPTVNAGTIGNSGATFNGASMNLTGNVSVNAVSANQIGNTATILEGTIASTSAAQPNITSLGTLTSLNSSGNITAQTANVYAADFVANTATYSPVYYYANGLNILTPITNSAYGNSNVATYLPTYNGNIGNLVTGNLIPLANTTYYLGNSTNYYANAYANYFVTATEIVTPKVYFPLGGSTITEDNSLDLLIQGPYQVSIKPNGSYQYTFGNDGRITGPGGTFVYSNGAVYGNLLATGLYWSNGVSYASTVTGTYSNSNVATYLATYSGNLSAGNITVSNGGVITGYLNGAIGANGANSATFTTATITNSANSYGSGQGALQITGGFYAGGDSYIAGNLVVANLTSLGSTSLVANAPLLYLEVTGISNYNYEIGFYSHKYDAVEGYNHTGLVRNHVDNAWFLFSNIRTEPGITVDLANANIVYDTLKLGNVIAYSGNTSTSTTTGAAVIYGGMGVGGNIYAAAIQGTPIGNGVASTGAFTNVTATANISAQTSNVYAGNLIGNTATYSANYYWSNGLPFAPSITGTYGNSNVAAYLTTYTGNLSAGNVSVSGNLNVSGNINNVLSNVYSQGGIFYGAPTTGFNALYAGQSGYTPLSQTLVQVSGNYNGFVQVNEQNTNSGASASTDFIATANNGNDNDTYIDLGINSSGYLNATYGLQAANDGYLYVAGNTTTGGGNLVVSTTTANDIIFSLGGISTANEFARMRANTNSFVISSTTTSTSTTTGALQVRGGIGTNGNIYAAAIQNTPIGNGTPSTGVFTSVTLANGGQFVGYFTGPIGANTANSGTFTSVTTTNGGQISGYLTGAIGANTANSAVFTTVTASGNITAQTANVYAANFIGNTALYGAQYYWTNGATLASTITGNYGNANVASYLPTYTGNLTAGNIATVSGGQISGYLTGAIGANVANSGVFTTANVNATLYAATINAATIGNSGATFTGASINLTGNIAAGNVNLSGALTSANVIANSGTTSTSSTTGAVIVTGSGGVGVGGNIYSGANINATTAVIAPSMYNSNIFPASGSDLYKNTGPNGNLWINYNGYVANLIVNGNTTAGYGNLFTVNGSTGQVGIKQPLASFIGNSSFQINATDSMLLPVGTTSQRPSNAQGGMVRYNNLTNQLEYYNGTAWTGTGSTFTTVSSNQFTGDGTTTSFTLSQGATTNSTIVSINGVVQIPTTAYSVSGTTLTFTEAPLSTDVIDARVIVTTSVVTSISDMGGGNAVVANTNGVFTTANNSVRIVANTSTYFNGGIAAAMNPISLTQNTPTTIDSFSTTLYRVAKYVIKVSDSTNSVYSGAEVIVAHNGTTATSQVYGVVNTGSNSLATFSSTVSGGNVNITANTWSSTATATVFPTYMPV